MSTTRPEESSKYESFHDPVAAISYGVLEIAILDYAKLGGERHRQRCRYGRDWKRHNDKSKRKGDFVPPKYRELQEKLAWLYSQQFGFMTEILKMELEGTICFFIRLLAGRPLEEDESMCCDN